MSVYIRREVCNLCNASIEFYLFKINELIGKLFNLHTSCTFTYDIVVPICQSKTRYHVIYFCHTEYTDILLIKQMT